MFDWHIWCQYLGKRTPHTTMPILLPQSDQFGFSGCQTLRSVDLFICARFISNIVVGQENYVYSSLEHVTIKHQIKTE